MVLVCWLVVYWFVGLLSRLHGVTIPSLFNLVEIDCLEEARGEGRSVDT